MKGNAIGHIGISLCCLAAAAGIQGCGASGSNGKTEIEIVQYKPEAAGYFDMLEEKFNASHDDIQLKISSPNDAMTILKTRFIREDYPDIIGIGGDIDEALKLVPVEGAYAVPYVANAAGVLYNREMFAQHGWEIPQNWSEFTALCGEIQSEGILPFYFGFKDTWTCLAPWNAMAVSLAPADVTKQVNRGETNFAKEYREVSEKYLELLQYAVGDPFAYGYNDACTAFARGEAAMYPIGSYAIPQILSVNPDLNIDSFVMPANDGAEHTELRYRSPVLRDGRL